MGLCDGNYGMLGGLAFGGIAIGFGGGGGSYGPPSQPEMSRQNELNRLAQESALSQIYAAQQAEALQGAYRRFGDYLRLMPEGKFKEMLNMRQEKPKEKPKPKTARQALQWETDKWLSGVFER